MSGWARFATVFFILPAIVCIVAGTHMTSIMSVSGSTINEAYYQAIADLPRNRLRYPEHRRIHNRKWAAIRL